jgi:uncharacterized protein (DUF58 family)
MTLTGRLPLLLALGVPAVVLRPEASTLVAWVAGVAALVVVDLALAVSPRALEVHRLPVRQVRLGGTSASTLVVVSRGRRRLRGLLRDGWQPSAGATSNRHRLDLRPGDSVRITTSLAPTRRGDRRAAQVTVRSTGPLGLAARQRSWLVPGSVRTLPTFRSRRHLPSRLARLRDTDGRSAVRVRGQGTEFDSLREYVRGDDVRSIDWRATARSRAVVVRTWQPERDRQVVLLLDTSRTSAARCGDVPRLDAAMDAALLLTALATRAGDHVAFLAGDRRVRASMRAGGSRNVLASLVDAMADLEPVLSEASWPRLAAALGSLGRRRALVVLLTSLDRAAVEHGLLPVLPTLTKRHRVVVASVKDPALGEMAAARGDAMQAYAAAAAEHVLTQRRQVAAVLARLGVDVLDADPDDLPVVLTDHYLDLKSSGRW